MKKILLFVLMVLIGVSLVNLSYADESRTIPKKSIAVTATGVVFTRGVTIYNVTGYANGTNSTFGIYDAATLGTASNSTCKIEGGEASQYEKIGPYDFGEDGLVFDTGLTVVTTNDYLTIVYR